MKKIGSGTLLALAGAGLSLLQMVVNNKTEAKAKADLKAEVTKEVMEQLSKAKES